MMQTISRTFIDIIHFDLLFGNLALSTTFCGYATCHQNNKSTLQPPPERLQESAVPVHVGSRGTICAKGVHNIMLMSINILRMHVISSIKDPDIQYLSQQV